MNNFRSILFVALSIFCFDAYSISWEGNEFCVTTGIDILNKYGAPEDRIDRHTGEVQYLIYPYEK